MPKLASQYPCHCHERAESCACVPGRTPTMSRASQSNAADLCVNGQHLEGRSFATARASKPPQGKRHALLHDQLQIAAEYWHRTENFETHWATQWSSEDVSRFISLITGSYPDALQLNGKQLLRLAIATHARHARVDNEDIANEFYELVISTIHRKKIVRLFLQKNPPENANAVKAPGDATSKGASNDQGRSHAPTPRGFAVALPSARLSAASEERDRIEALQSHGDRPVLTVSGQTRRAGGACHHLEVKLSVASFLLEQLKTPEGELPAIPQALAKKAHHGLHAGVDLEVCIHSQGGTWMANPRRQSICWLRQQHDLSFDLEGESETKLENASRSASPQGSCAQGHVEVWAGPILLARVLIQLPNDATNQGASSTSSFAHSEHVLLAETAFHQRVALVCGPREFAFRNAVARIETNLRGCTSVTHVIKDEVDLYALWGSDEERANGLVQVSLSRASLSSKAVLQAAETLLRLVEAADGTDEITPSIVVHTWAHPRPDVETNPIMARLLGQIGKTACTFHRVNSLLDTSSPSSSVLSRDVTDNQEHGFYPHAPAKLQRLAPGTPVDFQVPGSSSESKWKQGKIVSVSPHDGNFTIAPDNGGKAVHGVLEHQVRISSFGKAPSTSHRHHPGSQSKRLAKRSRKRRDIFASLCVGDRIFARPHSGLGQGDYQPGVIVALHKSSFTADVAFDSGRAVAHMDIRDVRPHPSQQHAAQDHRRQESPRASGETESKSGNVHTRASTGAMPHGTPVQIIKSTESAAVGITGRVRRALEFGLRYDIMLSNGDTMHNVPVGLLRRLDAERDASSDASQNSNVIGSHSYVDAICDRYKQVLRDAAQSRPDGKELRIQFDRLDKNRTGQLEASDFLEALHDLGFKPSESEVLEFIDRMSERRDGFVTYEDFVRFALPHGIQIGQRQLKRPLAFYKASLESSGVLRILESVLETRLGELWERLADLDTMSLGILQEDVFTRCLTRLGARASADQYSALTRTFADSDGKVDYREFAVVVEVLLVQKITNASVQLTTQVQSTRRSSAHDERMDKDGRLLGPMERKLRKEIDAATRIQALARRRIAQRSIAIQKRQQLRAAQVAEVWTGSGCEGSHIEGKGPQHASGKTFERHAQVIEEWRKLMLLNTRNGAEVMTTFRAMDRDCDGLVSLEELSATLCKYSIDARRAGMIMREMDLDNDGAVDLTDFKMFLAGVRQRVVARDTALASTQPAIHVMIDELGQDLCAKLRRYFAVLKRCGTDLLELLLYRPRGLTMTSVLRKQGFVLERPEWKRLEVHFASMADHRGDRSVCEDFVRLLGMSLEEFDQQQFSKHEHHLREYLQNTKIDSDGISGLGRLSHKVVSAIKDLCKDESHAESKHEALWWLLSLQEPGEPLTLDRVDLERFFRALKLRPTSFETDHLFGAQRAEPNGSTIQCTELAKLFGISPRVYEYLEEDHMYSRFCRSYVMTHRARLRVEAVEAITFVRREGSAAFVRWLRDAIGVSAYRKFRAMVIAAVSRGVRVTSGAWLSERTSAKLGFSSSTQLERVLLELNFGLSQDEIRNLCRALVQAASGDVDLFAFADLCEVIYATAALGESGGSGKAGTMGDADDEAREKAREETERYLREVIQEYIRTPTGHRNLVQVFESFDTQRNGTLDQSELEAVFKSLGVDLAKVDTGSLLRHYDVNQDGQLSYHEFLEAIDVRVHPVAEEMPKKVRYGQGKSVTKATQIDLDLLRDKLEKYNLRVKLCREDVDDACARVTSRGLLSRRDVMDILAALGLGHCLTDSEVYSFSRLTRRKFKAFLLDVVKGRFSLAPRDNARALGTVSAAAGEKGSTSSSNASITADTKVVLKMAPHTGKIGTVVGPGRSAGTYEICLEGNGQAGKILDNVRRSQLRVTGGRPMICENTVVIDKATQQRGIVIRFALSDPDHVDVRFQNMIRKHVASSTLEALPADVSVANLSRGRRVFARSDVDDQYFAGSILRVDGRNGSADVQFDHGEREMGVPLKHIKPLSAKTSA